MSWRTLFVILLLGGFAVHDSPAQEINALITGTVTDPSGAAVAGAAVTVLNLGTGVRAATKSGADGTYFLTQLPRGDYRLTVEAAGFRQYNREPITLSVGDKANVPVILQLGATTDSVTVAADLTGVESNQDVTGQLLATRELSELPTNGRSFFMMLDLTAGVIFTTTNFGPAGMTMPNQWSTGGGGSAAFVMHGGMPNSNSFMMDGATQGMEGGMSYIPPPESIENVKVVTPTSDASYGLSGGGVVNMTMKSGTNQLHATLGEFFRNNHMDANFIQTNLAAQTQSDLVNQRSQYNNFAAVVSGPIIKNKFFFSGNYDGFRLRQAYPVTITLPTMAQRAGDFSGVLNANGKLIVISDPLTTMASGNNYVRTAFPGNRIPANRLDRVALNIEKLMPVPNTAAGITNAFNYTNNSNIGEQNYDSEYSKFDYVWSDKNRSFISENVHQGHTIRSKDGIPYGNPLITGDDFDTRHHYSITMDHVYVMNATTVLNVRLAWDRWTQGYERRSMSSFDGSTLGFNGPSGANPVQRMPELNFTNYDTLASSPGSNATRSPYTFAADLSKTLNRHLLRAGAQGGQVRYNFVNFGKTWNGSFTFTPAFTNGNPLETGVVAGDDIASFLLGFPNSGSTDMNSPASYEDKFIGMYVQDDFKATPRLTLNFGVRWDIQTAPTERFNRLDRGFDPNVTYPLGNSQAQGGLLFADADHRQAFSTKYRDFQPRFGVAYQVSRKLVWRGGYGLSFLPLNSKQVLNALALTGVAYQYGFSRSTPYVATVGGGINSYFPGLPGTGTLDNPFPSGILQPYGAAQGPKTLLGQAITYYDPNYVIPRVHQFHVGFTYELPWAATIEASYVGSRTRRLPVTKNLDAVSLSDVLQGVANPKYLSNAVPNPFAGAPELAGTTLSGATITNKQALLPFPQFTKVSLDGNNIGYTTFNSLELRANKRLRNTLILTCSYTFAKALEATSYRAPQTPDLLRGLSAWDRTHQVAIRAVYELPIGRGRPLGRTWPKALDLIAGNWQYNLTYKYMNGTPAPEPNAIPIGDPRLPEGQQTLNRWFNTCTLLTSGVRSNCASPTEPLAWRQLKSNELPTASAYFPSIRERWVPQVNTSLMKMFPVRERVTLRFRLEALNALNNRTYGDPTISVTSAAFGAVAPNQTNFPRELQLSLQLQF